MEKEQITSQEELKEILEKAANDSSREMQEKLIDNMGKTLEPILKDVNEITKRLILTMNNFESLIDLLIDKKILENNDIDKIRELTDKKIEKLNERLKAKREQEKNGEN